ncbi:unnamed protein product [Urochloa decumbens]|uniref:F-box domain-containing protein n=1 Tax=Urochloa decumbens TaxID=240449 RepID=A0ABC9BWI7_9POAL
MDTVTTTAAIRLSDLPNDNIIEILTRVPDAVSLFRCTVVCKRWRDIVSHPAFLHRRFGDLCPAGGGVSSLLGFFVQRHLVSTNARSKVVRNTPSWAPIFVPAPGSALGPTRRFLTSFLVPGDGDDARVLDDAKPLVARDGLVLLRLLPAKFRENKAVLRLCVCDLLTGKHNLLPPIDDIAVFGGDGAIGYAVLRSPAAAAGDGRRRPADGYSTLFRVLIVGVHHLDGRVYIGEVSSDADAPAEPFWAAIGGELLVTNGRLRGCRRAAAVVGGGAATWFFHGDGDNNVVPDDDGHHEQNLHAILCVRTDTGRVCASRLVPFVEDCSAWQLDVDEEGKFSLLIVRDRRLAIMTKKDADGHMTWRPIHGVHNNNGGGADDRELSGMEPVCVAEKSGAMLVLYRSDPDHAYLLDIHSGSRTVVAAGKRSLNYATAVPCEIDLVEFFMARLGVQAAAADPKAA